MWPKQSPPGRFIVVSGPSGAGKTTVIDHLISQRLLLNYGLERAISHTTRKPRGSEVDGVDYHFISVERFQEMQRDMLFMEHANVFGNLYGTTVASVREVLARGNNVIKAIDVQGALQISQYFPEAVLVFIAPPSKQHLERWLRSRGADEEFVIQLRLETADKEMLEVPHYDYLIINEEGNSVQAANQLSAIIQAAQLAL